MIIETIGTVQMTVMDCKKRENITSKFSKFSSVLKKFVKSKIADLFYDKDLEEESLGCVIKRTRFMVSNDLNTPRVMECWPRKPLPFLPIPHRSEKTSKSPLARSE